MINRNTTVSGVSKTAEGGGREKGFWTDHPISQRKRHVCWRSGPVFNEEGGLVEEANITKWMITCLHCQ